MHIFNEDYPYKLKLLGFSLQEKEKEYIKANMYMKTHGQIYTISYIVTTLNKHFLTCTLNYDDVEIFQAQYFGVCNENLSLARVTVEHTDLIRKNIPNAHILIKLLEEGANIIATDYFAIDISSDTLILYPEKFEKASMSDLLRKLNRS